jgi:CubicO group peptidase (beta-lactamase class C family)
MTFMLAALAFAAFSQTNSIQNSPPLSEASPSSVGISEERLLLIDDMLKEAVAGDLIPGAVALVARNGKIVYHKAHGLADHLESKAQKKDDIFRIASQTKAITSTAVMMLWEEGKFRLDDPISRYIPEFQHMVIFESFNEADSSFTAKPAEKPITIRQLLTHTSGVGYGFIDNDEFRKIYAKAGIIDAFSTQDVSIEENIKKLAKMPLHFEPGTKFKYAEGLDILGYLIEKLSGMPLDQFFQEGMFDPLGMQDTYFYLPDSKADRLVSVQTLKDGKWERVTSHFAYDPEYPVVGAKRFFSGGGGLCSTAKDYASFLQMYLNKGELNGKRLLSRTTVDIIMANHIGDFWDPGSYHGLAFGVVDQTGADRGGSGSAGTFDWGGYFNTQYFADPNEQIIGILMKQTLDIPGDPTGWKFRQMVFQTIDD